MRTLTSAVLMIALALQLVGCSASKTTKGTAIGTGSGAVVGGVIGKQLGNTALGAILGAAIGGAAGSYIGSRMDKQAEELQKELAEAEVNRVGEGIQVTLKSGLLFDTNKSTLQPVAKTELQEFASNLNKYPDTNLLIEGHADSQGEEAYNQKLSEQRAAAVADFLIQQKVDPARITTKGYGETQPKMSNDTAEGRAANRRVEIIIVANEKLKQEAVANTKS
ncbi:OmpA family protein [bacterium]|nr:OmpA family protein [bacterium]